MPEFSGDFSGAFGGEFTEPPVPVDPYPNDIGDEMYEEFRPLVDAYGDPNGHLHIYTHALGMMLKPVDDISKDGLDGEPGWSQIFDLTRAKTEWLPWMGQLVGYQVPTRPDGQSLSDYDEIQRERMVTRSSWLRGTVDSLKNAALDHLAPGTSASRVIVNERVAEDPWRIGVWVYASDIIAPETAADVERAVRKVKLAELLLDFTVLTSDPTYALLDANSATYAIMKSKFVNYADVKTDPGRT
jgi:hypothetical protein